MTMQIKGVRIAGLPAVTVRNMLRRVSHHLDVDLVAERCKVAVPQAKELIEQLVRDGYIAFEERDQDIDYYTLTDKGQKLGQASATNKMLHLKARTKGLSLHELFDFMAMEKDRTFAYEVLLGDTGKVAEQIARGSSVPA